MERVLVVEDEREMLRGLRDLLESEGYEVLTADGGRAALERFADTRPDLVILDLMLPDLDGIEVCRRIRALDHRTPVLMLTARTLEHDTVVGFEAGADDYVAKPFSVSVLLARARALLRRRGGEPAGDLLRIGPWSLDTGRFTLGREGRETPLTFYEVEVLKLLHAHAREALSRDWIFRRVWDMECDAGNRTVDNFIVKLRKKLEDDRKRPRYLITVYGKGYKLVP